ncbi:YccT family protein [Vibrio sinaloensis]|uniref:YccT family protein n=1 Tax=Photobacterium sp. (strain ATCC 43367) TaxID=379097 RepID=UPI0020632594|nr:DUF2057 domain-containing protein [Vibrio sinaloensis]UPQ87032.1 DUF2057 domain-containing protein [Vibrio sinaloensis]
MKKTLTIFASLMAFNLSAAELVPASGVSILYINGQEAQSKIRANQVDSGFNQVVVRMDKDVGRGSGNGVFTSKPYVITFDVTGEQIKIDHPTARSIKEAEIAFKNDKPKWSITQDGQPIKYQQELLPGKKGMLPYMGMAELIESYNQQKGIYFDNGQLVDKPVEVKALPVAAAATAVAATTKTKPTANQPKATPSSNVEQLKAWYLKSSKEERKAFRRWMIDQE